MTTQDNLLYKRQYLIGPRVLDDTSLAHWLTTPLSSRYVLMSHPDLPVVHAHDGNKRALHILGEIFDPDNTLFSNADVAHFLLDKTSDFQAFELATKRLCGNFICVLTLEDSTRIYPDACGIRTVYYTTVSGGDADALWLAAQPGLFFDFLSVKRDRELLQAFRKHGWPGWWPGTVTPFEKTLKLACNHYLDLETGGSHRFWPQGPLYSFVSLDDSAEKIVVLLKNILKAMAARGPYILSMSGGYDSRIIFACTDKCKPGVEAYSMAEPAVPRYDLAIPRALCKRYNINYKIIRSTDAYLNLIEVYRKNTGYALWDPSSIMLPAAEHLSKDALIVSGALGELLRIFYQPKLTKYGDPKEIDAEVLAKICEFSDNPIAVDEFSAWLESLPENYNFALLDFLYWEQRAGSWYASTLNGANTYVNSVPPFNCRELLEIALSVPQQYKLEPHELALKICEIAEPGVLDYPFNMGIYDKIRELFLRLLPWRIRNAMERWHYSRAGLRESHALNSKMYNLSIPEE